MKEHQVGRADLTQEDAVSLIDPRLTKLLGAAAVQDLLGAACGLPPATARSLSSSQLDLLRSHRVLPLIPEGWSQSDAIRNEKVGIAASALSLERSWIHLAGLLGEHKSAARLLKGMATGHLDYRSPAMRHTGDIDVLLPQDALPAVTERLLGNGYRHLAWFDERRQPFEKGVALVDPDGVEVDLHARLIWKRSSVHPSLFTDPEHIPALDADALPKHLRLIHAALHFIGSEPGSRRLSGCADVSVLLSQLDDLEQALEGANRLGVAGVCREALVVTSRAANSTKHSQSLQDWPSPSRLQHAAFCRPRRVGLFDKAARIDDIPGISSKAKYISLIALPRRSTQEIHGGWRRHIGRAFKDPNHNS